LATSVEGGPLTRLVAKPGDRGRMWGIVNAGAVMAMLLFAAVVSHSVLKLRSEVAGLNARLWAADTKSLRLEQQLDRVFQTQSRQWRRGAPLRADDLTLLQTWLTFDTAFAVQNRDDRRMICEVAMAHQRAGQCALLLGDCPRSIEHIREAVRLYESLVSSHPSAADYLADVACANALLGEALEETGETHEAVSAYREAVAVLGAPDFPRTGEDERLLSEWTERLDALTVTPSSLPER
jgi:tetratricopeptide (TPR) repeat protein